MQMYRERKPTITTKTHPKTIKNQPQSQSSLTTTALTMAGTYWDRNFRYYFMWVEKKLRKFKCLCAFVCKQCKNTAKNLLMRSNKAVEHIYKGEGRPWPALSLQFHSLQYLHEQNPPTRIQHPSLIHHINNCTFQCWIYSHNTRG